MLGAVPQREENLITSVKDIYSNFTSSLSDDLQQYLPSREELNELKSDDDVISYLNRCWLTPQLSPSVVTAGRSLCKVFVVRKENDHGSAAFTYALGETCHGCNINLECYDYLKHNSKILSQVLNTHQTKIMLHGLTRIVEKLPQCRDLINTSQLMSLIITEDAEIRKKAEHLLAVCNDLNDDVFNDSYLPSDDYLSSLPNRTQSDTPSDDSSGDIVLPFPLFSTGRNSIHIKQMDTPEKAIVCTSNIVKAIADIGQALERHRPVLLQGLIGSGKTTLLEHVASLFGLPEKDLLSVQVDEQTDSKILIGNYVCAEVPGHYTWQPGILSRAAVSGKWIIFEDIDHAPSDIISLIKSVIETQQIQTPSCLLSTHPNFTVFLTQRITEAGYAYHYNPVLSMLDKTFVQVKLQPYDDTQLKQVISGKFPTLAGCSERLVNLYNSLSHRSLRQLIRWSTRVQGHLTHNLTVVTKEVFLEAVDCFCSWQSSKEKRTDNAHKIGAFLSLPKSKVESYLTSYLPTVSVSNTHYSVGRSTVPCTNPPHSTVLFAQTRHSLVLLEKLACAVQHDEPALLTGETGNGKTASVQHLAARTGNRLVVINMSQQSDTSDLIGGFKPQDVIQLIKPIYESFELLFKESFSVSKNAGFLHKVQICWRQKEWSTLLQAILHISKKMNTKSWLKLRQELEKISHQIRQIENSFAFSFVEGSLVSAVRKGDWVLLDEINLAPSELLESLNCILDDTGFLVVESGEMDVVKKHPNFRLFAAMNPSTDVGKRDLPVGIKNRFTEVYVDEMTEEGDLRTLTAAYLHHLILPSALISKIVSLYTELRREARDSLTDGRGHKPCYSIRTLCRALKYIGRNPCGNVLRSMYEGFCLSFLTQLDRTSYPKVRNLIIKYILPEKGVKEILKHKLPQPADNYVLVEGYWLRSGEEVPHTAQGYIMTPTVRENLRDLARAVSSAEYPVLLQGPTSAGKTSVVKYLAGLTGTKVIRINNHEHTDIQEYVGSYCVGDNDKLVFKEGLLVDAMRFGYWLILDELNLAPTDVLEALNRVLDDNRELFISETQTAVKAHPHFMLFATQNPAGSYGGRKVLSRAFRNRFIELHYEDLPHAEIMTIIAERCELPVSYSKKIISVMEKLQSSRTKSGIFAGRHGLMTLRDLFRWSDRYRLSSATITDWDQMLANDGYMLLSGKVRRTEEEDVIKSVLQIVFKRKINTATFYDGSLVAIEFRDTPFDGLVWTPSMLRLLTLVSRSLQFHEPVLLVGETGCGKTTICQVMSELLKLKLHTVNCHMHSDTADFIGSLRPVRDHTGDKLFEWVDGPLVEAMRNGDMILLDEISLADDSVLERLNSVLEPERQLTLAESSDSVTITAHQNFRVIATMNPGGDFGKKELSPALRNRFTEIWCGSGDSVQELHSIVHHNLVSSERGKVASLIIQFIEWFREQGAGKLIVTVRDALTWAHFLNATEPLQLSLSQRYLHGGHLVMVDGLSDPLLRKRCSAFLTEQCGEELELDSALQRDGQFVVFGKMRLQEGPEGGTLDVDGFSLGAPTTAANILRIVRGLQVNKPILLEGHPGVGKTSITTALAKLLGFKLTRINLSEQTDMSDLFGCDLPDESGKGFSWRDGPLLKALKHGHWVLLDEMNLASQAVLEGLNACLDHRGEVYIPELCKSFKVGAGQGRSRFIACMNPVDQGAGRKALPKSFLNRFVKVYIETLTAEDMKMVLSATHSKIPQDLLSKMISFNQHIHKQVVERCEWGRSGSPWEFNLRDTRRWCDLISTYPTLNPTYFIDSIYTMKFRCHIDRQQVHEAARKVFGDLPPALSVQPMMSRDHVRIGPTVLPRYSSSIRTSSSQVTEPQLKVMDTLAQAVHMNWLSILVGPISSGKSSVVRTLAGLCGRDLLEIACSSVFDTSELLGGFSQVSELSAIDSIQELVTRAVRELISENAVPNDDLMKYCREVQSGGDDLVSAVQRLIHQLQSGGVSDKLRQIGEKIFDLFKNMNKDSSGMFEWRNSPFVEALIEGKWVIMDNANLISPSVLDRLNPLLERDGKLVLDERGHVDGKPTIIKPHPQFRLFMTMDPRYGELSRPMRNRGMELFLEFQFTSPSPDRALLLTDNSTKFNITLYTHFFRRVSAATEDIPYLEDVMRTTLAYLPPSVWASTAALFGKCVAPWFVEKMRDYLVITGETWKGHDFLACSDSRLNFQSTNSIAAQTWYSKFECSSFAVSKLDKNGTFRDLVYALLAQQWNDSLTLRKFLVLAEMFAREEVPSFWWELRAPLANHPLTKVQDERHGAECDDTHWKLVECVGHPPLERNIDEATYIDEMLADTEVFEVSDATALKKLFRCSDVPDDFIPSAELSGNAKMIGTTRISLLLTEALLHSSILDEQDKNKVQTAVSPYLTPYLHGSLSAFQTDPLYYSDVLASLITQHAQSVTLSEDTKKSLSKILVPPSFTSYKQWKSCLAGNMSNIVLSSLIEGSALLDNVDQDRYLTLLNDDRRLQIDVKLETLMELLEQSCSLSMTDPVEHYAKLHASTSAFVAVLVQLREIHAGIQMCSQDRVNEAVYPFIDINQHMSTELSALEEFASKQGYRPVKPTYEDLRSELSAFNKNICRKAPEVYGDVTKTKSWMKSVSTFVRSCYSKFWHYRDVMSPLMLILHSLCRKVVEKILQSGGTPRFALFKDIEHLEAIMVSKLQELKVQEDLQSLGVLVLILVYRTSIATNAALVNQLKVDLIKAFYVLWTKNEELISQQEKCKESLYKDTERFKEADTIETSVKELFPTFDDFEDINSENNAHLLIDNSASRPENSDGLVKREEFANFVQELVLSLRTRGSKSQFETQAILTKCFVQFGDAFTNQEEECQDKGLIVGKCWNILELFTEQTTDEHIDIYRGSYPTLVLEISPLLLEIGSRVANLLMSWPDHPALLQIVTVIERISSFPVDQPIIKFLQGMEILLSKCQLWEGIASRKVSLSDLLTQVTEQIIRWRSKELMSWPLLFTRAHQNYVSNQNSNFLKLTNLVLEVESSEDPSHHQTLTSAILDFVERSTIGDFEERLKYIQLCYEALETSINPEIVKLLKSIYFYYQLQSPFVKTELEKGAGELRKKLDEYTKIVKWKDVNYFSVKQATEASHQKLAKFIKKFEEVLKGDVQQVLCRLQTVTLPQPSPNFHSSSHYRFEMVAGLRQLISDYMAEFSSASAASEKEVDKEKRLKLYKGLDLRKRKALSELFKCLGWCGLTFTKGISSFFSVDYYYILFKTSYPCAESAWIQYTLKTLLNLAVEPSQELGSTEHDRIRGFSGHLFNLVQETLQLRNSAQNQLESLTEFHNNLADLEGVSNMQQSTKTSLSALIQRLPLLLDCFHQTRYLTDAITKFDNTSAPFETLYSKDEVIEAEQVSQLSNSILSLHTRLNQLRPVLEAPHIVSIAEHGEVTSCEELFECTLLDMSSLSDKQSAIFSSVPSTLTLLHGLEGFVARIRQFETFSPDESSCSSQMLNSLLASLHVPEFTFSTDTLVKEWGCEKGLLINHYNYLLSTADSAKLDESIRVVTEILAMLGSFSKNNSQFKKLLVRVFQIVEDIKKYCEEFLTHVKLWLDQSLLPLTETIATLFKDVLKRGYCKPSELEEAEKEGGETFDSSEGGGVGEGEGGKDVSDQITSEDQVEGTKNEESKEQDDVKEEEGGVEMEDDFDGALGDVEEREGEESDENDDASDNEAEQDEQMGGVDDPDDKQKSENFGDKDEKLPDTEAEADTGAQSEQQDELVAKDDELDKETGEQGLEQQEIDEEEGCEAEEYNAEDDIPDPDAPGQQNEEEQTIEELPDNMEGLEDQEDECDDDLNADEINAGEDEINAGDDVMDGEDENQGNEEDNDVSNQQDDDNKDEEVESLGASVATHHSEPTSEPNAETESTQGTAEGETAESRDEGADKGQSNDPGGESSQPKSEDTPEDNESGKRQRQSDPKQISDKQTAKRAKTQPKSLNHDESNKVEIKDTDVFEHTEEGEEYDKDVMDAAQEQTEGAFVDQEDENVTNDSMMEEHHEEDDKQTDKQTESLGKVQKSVEEAGKVDMETEDQPSSNEQEKDDVIDSRTSHFATDTDYDVSRKETVDILRSSLMSVTLTDGLLSEAEGRDRWSKYEAVTSHLSQELCEQLRLILEPTKAAKLKGDYKTGKRLNMKRIIPYIASRFQKDKIWLRRNKPSAREYQVMIALDNSASMASAQCVQMSLEAVAVICGSLSKLEIGQLGVCSFGEDTSLVIPFNEPFTLTSGSRIIRHFTFEDTSTDVIRLLDVTRAHFAHTASLQSNQSVSQLLFVVSDGRGLYIKGVEAVKKAVKESWDAGVFMVFLIIDKLSGSDSILDVRTPVFDSSGKLLRMESYLDSFPFPYYLVLREPSELPLTLADALRQWIEIVVSSS